ncbi:hypothetical protein K438DRAFT_1222556 [Mycena galopus ATCC 62051]|nr:hypothetical protein K438DRAFT_1222556 [Mycena galopus ATCC 62051]
MAMRLSQVRAPWRALVLSMPTLWASFSIQLAQQNSPRIISQRQLLHLHLERSDKCPLSFDADFGKPETFVHAKDILVSLVDHSTRWLNVKMPFCSVFAFIYPR